PSRRWHAAHAQWALALILALCAAVIHAHEPGVGRAVVTFPSPHEYVVDLTVDAASLLGHVEVLVGQPRSQTLTGAGCAARLSALQQERSEERRVGKEGRCRGVARDEREHNGRRW